MSLALESERYRAERLESQINDLTELHQVKQLPRPPEREPIDNLRFL